MKNIIANLFRLSAGAVGNRNSKPAATSRRDNPLTIQDGSENAARKQLIQILLRDLLVKTGIPAAWIRCEMLMVSSRSKGQGMIVRLIVSHWDDRLMQHLYAVQKRFLADIAKFEPDCSRWLHGLSWEFEVGSSCLCTELPAKEFWTDSAAASNKPAAAGAKPSSGPVIQSHGSAESTGSQQMDDVEKLFAIRDRELGRQAGQGMTPVGYEKTQPASL